MFQLVIVKLAHTAIVSFVTFTPFIPYASNEKFLLHITSVLCLKVHWFYNNDACFLTYLETKLRGIQNNKSFIHSIVSPLYNISNTLVTNITLSLGLISSIRLLIRLLPKIC
jgi:hypothetical protein